MTDRKYDKFDLWYLPDRRVTVTAANRLRIKGRPGGDTRGVHFTEVYSAAPALAFDEAVSTVDAVFGRGTTDRVSAACDIIVEGGGSARPWSIGRNPGWASTLRRPFRIAECNQAKIADSMQWMHTNLSKDVSGADGTAAHSLFFSFAVLLKADDYFLARRVTPNGSITLQEALKRAVLPGYARHADRRSIRSVVNAQRLLSAQHGTDDLITLCELATFAGAIWFDSELDDLDLDILARDKVWGSDDRRDFLDQALSARTLVVLLDDYGEAVFDLALLLELLRRNPVLRCTVFARTVADGINVTAADVQRLVRDDTRRTEREVLSRLSVVPVDQPFPSMEPAFLPRRQRDRIVDADVVLVKGAGFFETALFDRPVFHSFVVHGTSSVLLTGYPRGVGVFRLVEGAAGAYDPSAVLERQPEEGSAL